jgi:hypothetical protein
VVTELPVVVDRAEVAGCVEPVGLERLLAGSATDGPHDVAATHLYFADAVPDDDRSPPGRYTAQQTEIDQMKPLAKA